MLTVVVGPVAGIDGTVVGLSGTVVARAGPVVAGAGAAGVDVTGRDVETASVPGTGTSS